MILQRCKWNWVCHLWRNFLLFSVVVKTMQIHERLFLLVRIYLVASETQANLERGNLLWVVQQPVSGTQANLLKQAGAHENRCQLEKIGNHLSLRGNLLHWLLPFQPCAVLFFFSDLSFNTNLGLSMTPAKLVSHTHVISFFGLLLIPWTMDCHMTQTSKNVFDD